MNTTVGMKEWIARVLIGSDGYFVPQGFESSLQLYLTPLSGSFLLSLLDGIATPLPFLVCEGRSRYAELIRAVQRGSDYETANWFYITNPDNALSILEWVRPLRREHPVDVWLDEFERSPAKEGGVAFLGLAPDSKRWLLLHEYEQSESFKITVHGAADFCARVAEAVGLSKTW